MDAMAPSNEAAWVLPGRQGTPAEALARIGVICGGMPDLFGALLAVLGTHQAVAVPILAAAVKQFRPDVADLSTDDVAALLTAIRNGGIQGFEAVLRSRRKSERKAGGFKWGADTKDMGALVQRRR